MPRSITTFNDVGEDREIDLLHARIDALEKLVGPPKTIRIAQRIDPSSGAITVQDSSGNPSLLVSGIEFQTADGVTVSLDGDFALIAISNPTVPSPSNATVQVGAVASAGASTDYVRGDFVPRGVHSLVAGTGISVSSAYGDVTVSFTGGIGDGAVYYVDVSNVGNTFVPLHAGDITTFYNYRWGAAKNIVCNGADTFSDGTTTKSLADLTAQTYVSVFNGTFFLHWPLN